MIDEDRADEEEEITIDAVRRGEYYEFWIGYTPHLTRKLYNEVTQEHKVFNDLINIPSPHLMIVQDDEGNAYTINYSGEPAAIDDIKFLQQGRGYILKFNGYYNDGFTYPIKAEVESFGGGNGASGWTILSQQNNESEIYSRHFYYKKYTGEYFIIVIDTLELGETEAEAGDEIGVFNSEDQCVGGKVFGGDIPFNVTSCADDPMTEEIDGYIYGESITFRYWDASERVELELPGSYTIQNFSGAADDPVTPRHKGFGQGAYARKSLNFSQSSPVYIPENYILKQNYPNPFNPKTVISYSLPEISQVKIEIFNILGQRTAVLVDGIQCAGAQKITWDTSGQSLSSGIYFCHLTAQGKQTGKKFNHNIKMMLLK